MVFGSEAACIGETVACSCEQLSEQNFWKVTDTANDALGIPK